MPDHEDHVKRHHKKARKLKLWLVGLIALLVLVSGGLAYWYYQSQQRPESASEALQQVLQVQQASENLKPVRSKLGFAIKYYEPMIFGTGYILTSPTESEKVSGQDLVNSDDSYSVIALEDKDSEAPTNVYDPGFDIRATKLTISTSALKDFFAKRQQEYGDLSELELTQKHFEPRPVENKEYKLDSEEEITLGSTVYKKRKYSITDTQFAPTPDGGEIHYYTVQNNRPYVFKLRYYTFTAPQKMTLFEDVVESTEYSEPAADARVLGAETEDPVAEDKAVLADTTDESLPTNSANIPYSLEARTILEVVAKNQLSVVRVGAIDCKDFDILLPNGEVGLTAKDACSPGSGTGAIVSKDGYISTNGHVVKHGYAPLLQTYIATSVQAKNYEPVKQYVLYLVNSGLISRPQMQALLVAVDSGNKDAWTKLLSLADIIPKESYKLGSESGQYAIQLSDEPIKLVQAGTKFSFSYSEEVVEAEFKDMNFDQYVPISKRDPKVSDVAILKIKQGTYPVARIGSLGGVRQGSLITSIGFPGFVDGGLVTTKERTVPSVTQGQITAIGSDRGSPLLLATTSVPGAQGNSGGPNFSESGESVGLTTYGGNPNDPEEGITKFGPGTMRNAADFTDLLAKNNITLDTNSDITTTWNQAIDRFAKAHYKAAVPLFEDVKGEYGLQYLVPAFLESAQAKIDNGEDRTPNNNLAIVAGVVFVLLLVGTGVVVVLVIKHHKQGPPPANMPTAAAPPPPAPGLPPAPAVQSLPMAQPLAQPMNASPAVASAPPQVVIQSRPPVPPAPVVTPPQTSPPASISVQPQPQVPAQQPLSHAEHPQPAPPAPHTVIDPSPTIELQIPHDQP